GRWEGMNSIDPRRLVGHEGDVEEAAREYEASKSADAAKKKASDEAPKIAEGDKSKTASGVSYAEYAKNAQKSSPACTSDHRENCPNDGPTTKLTVTRIDQKGATGVEVALTRPDRKDADIKYLAIRGEVGS